MEEEKGEYMKQTLFVPNGVVFLEDLSHPDPDIPIHDEMWVVLATRSCISVPVLIDVDGECTLELSNSILNTDKKKHIEVFSGTLETPGEKLAVSTSVDDRILEIDVKNKNTQVSVWVDTKEHSKFVFIEAS